MTEFKQQVRAALYNLSHYTTPGQIEEDLISLNNFLDQPRPSTNYFADSRYLGSGSYKEAFNIGGLCVKFANDLTLAQKEEEIYYRAAQYEAENIFCPTFFLPVPDTLKIHLSEISELNKSLYADMIMVQPIVRIDEELEETTSYAEYLDNPILFDDGTEMTPEEFFSIPGPLVWWQSIVDQYGDFSARDISFALNRLKIEDLRACNVGWLRGGPVIIDWYSALPA